MIFMLLGIVLLAVMLIIAVNLHSQHDTICKECGDRLYEFQGKYYHAQVLNDANHRGVPNV